MHNFPKQLPEKYYLDHFNEFIGFITEQCAHLLDSEHQGFVSCYRKLSHNAKCMFVRVINRQGCFIQIDKMIYQEIDDCPMQLAELQQANFLGAIEFKDIAHWLGQLTKNQLLDILDEYAISDVKKSAAKPVLLQQVINTCSRSQCLSSEVAKQFLVKNFEQCLAYLLFLFFGNTNSKLEKFSMRDLGMLKNRSDSNQKNARFNDLEQAKCVFFYSFKIGQLKRNELNTQEYINQNKAVSDHPEVVNNCTLCQQLKGEYFYLLGKQLLANHSSVAMQYLKASTHSKAQEKWLRELYKSGEKEQVKTELGNIIEHSMDDGLLLFAEDFYQRKFNQVKVSKLTKKLREDSYQLDIDQIHKDQVEIGVKQYYQRLNATAFRTENRLFNALFGLTFWQELFYQSDALATEFDRRPKLVKENTIYRNLEQAIEQRLQMYSDTNRAVAYLTKIAAQHYGQPNGMFRWNAKMIQIIAMFLHAASAKAVVKHLRAMAKNYHGLNDGYPDLMIIEHGKVRFEEVKAPGDAIRPNQFVSMNALQEAGFDVRVCRVEWFVDPCNLMSLLM